MKKAFSWFWLLMLVGFLVAIFRNVEPLKTINEMYSTPLCLLIFVFFFSSVVGFAIAFRRGREITKKAS